jgi:Xaa-Pro aminopeptidase
MLTAEGCRARRARLWERLDPRPDALVISNPKHLTYLANFVLSPFQFRSDDAGAFLLLTRDGRSTLIADNLLQPFLDRAHVDELCVAEWYRGQASAPLRRTLLCELLSQRLAALGHIGRLGLEKAWTPVALLEDMHHTQPGCVVCDVEPILREMRRAKDADELKLIRRSIEAGVAGFAAARQDLRPWLNEMDAFEIVQAAATRRLAEPVQIYGDFLSGPRTGQVSGPATHREIVAGDLVLLDFSVLCDNYRGDLADTFVCGGGISPLEHELFEVCQNALAVGEGLLGPGVAAREVFAAMHALFAKAGLDRHRGGHLGHGIGLSHPEPPFIVAESTDVLQVGDVLTLEPGVYFGGQIGMRIERNYVIRRNGCEVLSTQPFGLEQ